MDEVFSTKRKLHYDHASGINRLVCIRGLQTALYKTLCNIKSWFNANFLLMDFNKTYYLEFRTKKSIDTTLGINYFNKTIANVPYTKFLGIMIDDTVTWDNHTDQ